MKKIFIMFSLLILASCGAQNNNENAPQVSNTYTQKAATASDEVVPAGVVVENIPTIQVAEPEENTPVTEDSSLSEF